MTKKNKNLKRRYRILFFYYLRRIWRAKIQFLRVSFFVLLFLLLIIQSPWVQTFLLQKAADYLSEKTNFPIVLEEANIDFLGRIHIQNLRVGDRSGKKMIAVKNLLVDFDLMDLYTNRTTRITLNKVSASQLDFLLMVNSETKQYNINEFVASIQKLLPKRDPKKPKKTPPAFIIEDVLLNNCSFTLHDPLKDSVQTGQFDPVHFRIDEVFGRAENLRVFRDTVELEVKKISGIEKSINFPIDNITTYFRYCNRSMSFLGVEAHFGNSVLRDTLVFDYDTPLDMSSDFMNKVQIQAHLDSTVLQIKDLAVFAPKIKHISEILSASGNVKGTISQLGSSNIQLDFGKKTSLRGKFALNGLPNIQNTFVELDFEQSHIDVNDFETYLTPNDFEYISGFGQIDFEGDFIGFLTDFVTRGTFLTNFGKLETDLNLKLKNKSYEGKLALTDFELGDWLGTNLLGKIQMNGQIQGTGFKQKEADFELDAHISSLDVNTYHYQNIQTDGRFKEQHFTGKLNIHDPNLVVGSNGDLNLKDSTFTFKAHIDTVNLLELGYSKKEAFFKTYINADFRGLDVDKAEGSMHLNDTYFSHHGNAIELDYLSIFFDGEEEEQRAINVYSELVDIETTGNFKIKQLLKDLQNDWKAYQIYAQNDSLHLIKSAQENLNPIDTSLVYEFFADVSLKNINPLSQIFVPKLYISEDTYIKGRFFHETEKHYTIESNIDTLIYGNNQLYNSFFTLSAAKDSKEPAIDLELNFLSQRQKAGKIELENFELTANLEAKEVHFDTFVRRSESEDEIFIKGIFDFADTIQHLQIEPKKIVFFEHKWELQDSILNLSINKKAISFDKPVVFSSEEQEFWLNGGIAPDPTTTLKIGVDDMNIDVLSHFIKREVEGVLNVNAAISGVYDTLVANTDILVEDIKLDGYELGTLSTFSYWDDSKNNLAIDGMLKQKNKDVLDLNGTYAAGNEESPIDIDLKMIGLNLKTAEPFLLENVSEIEGKIYGAVKIKGRPLSLDFLGEAFVDRGAFKINYLNTRYHFSDKITFDKGYFGVKNFKLYDQNNKTAVLSGGVNLNDFKRMFVNLKGKMKNFLALNTTQKDNSLYYGTAVGTGKFEVSGSFLDLNISVDAKSEANTNIYLPLDGYEGVSEQSFIRFVQRDTVQKRIKKRFQAPQPKLTINMNLEITPDAYMEIIFDKKAGDIMRGNARGKMKMDMDTDGNFEMFGDVEIIKGAYNFTFLNVVNKEFGVKKGSRISWTGDPYHANLDLVATYSQLASFTPILQVDSLVANSPELKRRYPVQVDLHLNGDLMSPDIRFGIEFSNYPPVVVAAGQVVSLEGQLARFRRQIANNLQELNRQAFSLIVLKKFSAKNAFDGINQSAGNSVSELLSNQLSYWASQVDDNFEVNLDLGGLSQKDFNALQLRLSYSFLDGRVRVTREGGFTNVQNEANVASIAGNWTVEYIISKDGKLRAKAFHKNNSNTFSSTLGNTSSTGVGFLYTISFDHFSDLLKKARKKGQQEQQPKIIDFD